MPDQNNEAGLFPTRDTESVHFASLSSSFVVQTPHTADTVIGAGEGMGQYMTKNTKKVADTSVEEDNIEKTMPFSNEVSESDHERRSSKRLAAASASMSSMTSAPYVGLLNLGNTCYLNSCIQVLYYIPVFVKELSLLHDMVGCERERRETEIKIAGIASGSEIVDHRQEEEEDKEWDTLWRFLKSLLDLYEQLGPCTTSSKWTSSSVVADADAKAPMHSSVNPSSFLEALSVVNDMFGAALEQQDVHEFWGWLISYLESGSVRVMKKTEKRCSKALEQFEDDHQSNCQQKDPLHHNNVSVATTERERFGRRLSSSLSLNDNNSDGNLPGTKRMKHAAIEPEYDDGRSRQVSAAKDGAIGPVDYGSKSFVAKLFRGEIRSTVKCLECESKSHRDEYFYDIGLSIKRDGGADLNWSLNQFIAEDHLYGPDKYKCNICLLPVEALRSTRIRRLPKVLVFHLKRFEWSTTNDQHGNVLGYLQQMNKINHHVPCPETLTIRPEWLSDVCCNDAPPRVNNAPAYDLCGIIFHLGMSTHYGHYTAAVKLPQSEAQKDKEWLILDDQRASYASQQDVINSLSPEFKSLSTAYMVFYIRII